ncbi:Zn(II)2Cys6 transcription factor domain-containing protein [Aspergillus saccharolyticus JOP 1030-1]|uniref:C2H2 finger domain protein n=1 Tax=Aspergillus saccharolyticus JOP 1030-1 TaxID=1450539 RepID=A0A318Z9I1_9EURO|nr:hypothetical protein BP01DRAFT_425086 [Aspergillus saccharolyticus JOP 1030-1]PYH43077.1 hypothetical protein BP01DRAFT_425086 [Aspergillus saccharolyticus JOP 1030-1]
MPSKSAKSCDNHGGRTRVVCEVCHKFFSTKSHLRRHEASHAPLDKQICAFCGSAYRRRDVLRRHLTTCKQRGSHQPLSQSTPGRKRKACDACAEARSYCDGDYPCETCLQRGLQCTFARIHGQPRRHRFFSAPQCEENPENLCNLSQHKLTSQSIKLSIPFLLHYSNVENKSRYESLRLLSQCNPTDSENSCCAVNHRPDSSYMITEPWESLFKSFVNTATLDASCGIHSIPGSHFEFKELESISSKLLLLLKDSKSHSSDRNIDFEDMRQLFMPLNVAKFLEAFFDNSFHSHFINPVTFKLSQASTLLVLTMVLLGAVYTSPYSVNGLDLYSSITEHLIFDGPSFESLTQPSSGALDDQRTLETLQAAMLVVTLQAYKENPASIRRMRLQRLPALFRAIRMLNLNQIANDCIPGASRWDEYLLREGLVRVMAGIYLLDCYCVIFFRYPSQLRLNEITFAIPHRDDLFHARDATEWEQVSTQNGLPREPVRLRYVLHDLMRAEGCDPHREDYLPKTIFGSFLVLSALQCVLFDLLALHTFMDDPRMFDPVERGLDRWKAHWDILCRATEPAHAKRAGFIIHAVEYWWVAKALVRHPSAAGLPDDSHDNFHRLVERLMASDAY